MMQGRRHWRPPFGKARAMACGGNPRALPDLRADAVPPTPKKRGRRRLTALEVLQAKSAFCRSQRIFLRLACSWERFEEREECGSNEGCTGSTHWGGLTVLRIPSKKGKAGMLLDLGTRVGWRASRGG